MQYNYEFLKIEPKQLWVQVRFYADDQPDIFKNIIVQDFTEANIISAVKSHGAEAVRTWSYIEAAPETLTIAGGTIEDTPPKEVITDPTPEFDEFTQDAEQVITETDTTITYGWTVVDKTPEQVTAYLEAWRSNTIVTMRQARLALQQQGLLATVQSNIGALPETSQIEWEYAGVVERGSPLVATLAGALGLSDVATDDLFKLAMTL